MPKVNGKKYPYTKPGIARAVEAGARLGGIQASDLKLRPGKSIPLSSALIRGASMAAKEMRASKKSVMDEFKKLRPGVFSK